MPLSILAAILGALAIFLLATGLCKAAQLLRTEPLPDVIPQQRRTPTCHCSSRTAAKDTPISIQCVVKFEDPPTALVGCTKALPKLNPKVEGQRSPPASNSVKLMSDSQPRGNLTDEYKIEILNKELPYAGGYH